MDDTMQYLLGILERVNKLYKEVSAILRKLGITGIITERDEQFVGNIDKILDQIEPRVLTLEEVESSDSSVWLEKETMGWEPISVLVDKVGKYLDTFIASGGLSFQGEKSNEHGYGDYGKTWRCWSAKPTDEQREDTPWKE